MRTIALLLVALVCSSFASDASVNPCGLCQAVQTAVAGILQNGQIAEPQLEAALQQVCPAVNQVLGLADDTQCATFIQTYGDALAEIITQAQGATQQICQTLGVCSELLYTVLEPTFDSDYESATYEVSESGISSATFYYKIFTGGLTDEDNDAELEISLDSFENTALYVTIVDENGVGSWLSPIEDGDYVEIHFPTKNSWYYITVNASFVGDWSAGAQGQFHLQAIYESEDSHDGGDDGIIGEPERNYDHPKHRAMVFAVGAAALVCLLCCCCCCVRRMRRNCKRNGGCCRKNQQVPQVPAPVPAENSSVALEMNQVPQQPMMYYYAPTAPVAPQQMMYFMPQSDQVQYAPMQFVVQPQQQDQ